MRAAICRSDWHVWSGADPVDLPHIPGHEYCGVVVEAGRCARLARGRPGDRALHPGLRGLRRLPGREPDDLCHAGLPGFTCDGAFAERWRWPMPTPTSRACPRGWTRRLPQRSGCRVTTAWHALTGARRCGPGSGWASGAAAASGMAALMLGGDGRAGGAGPMWCPRSSQARDLGAEVVIDASGEGAAEAMREATGGGVDVAIEALGLPVTTANALRSLRKLGRMVQVGMPAGRPPGDDAAVGRGLWGSSPSMARGACRRIATPRFWTSSRRRDSTFRR
jgi:D-arabinose 1-dehydrogenase-like Zn-dependent alcohol dehydrogenase